MQPQVKPVPERELDEAFDKLRTVVNSIITERERAAFVNRSESTGKLVECMDDFMYYNHFSKPQLDPVLFEQAMLMRLAANALWAYASSKVNQ